MLIVNYFESDDLISDDLVPFVEFLMVVEHHGHQCFGITYWCFSLSRGEPLNNMSCQGNSLIFLKRDW